MNFKAFQLIILLVITSYAISTKTLNGRKDFRDSDSDESNKLSDKSNELSDNQYKFRKFWPIQKSRHSSGEWPESHEPRHHSQKSQEWQDSRESPYSKKHRKSHQSELHGPIDSIEFRRWEDLTLPPSHWDKAPPWLSCPSLTYRLQCEPGEKKNCHNDTDCGYSQKCCPIVGGGVMGRPLKCCRTYTRPSWWWPTDSPRKPCPHHQSTEAPTYLTTPWWRPSTTAVATSSTLTPTTETTTTATTTTDWWRLSTAAVATSSTLTPTTNTITTETPTTITATTSYPTTSGIVFPL